MAGFVQTGRTVIRSASVPVVRVTFPRGQIAIDSKVRSGVSPENRVSVCREMRAMAASEQDCVATWRCQTSPSRRM